MSVTDFHALAPHLLHLSEGEKADVRRAYEFAVLVHKDQRREDGSPYVTHVIAVAATVASWHADRDTIIAALLHDVLEDTATRRHEIAHQFGRRVAMLVESVTKFTLADLSPDLPLDRKIETLRKLFDVMRHDMRSVLIKLADRLHNVLTIDALPEERRRRFAEETLDVYHKIALHLGMRALRHQYAEYCVPVAYDDGLSAFGERDRSIAEARTIADDMSRDFVAAHSGIDIVRIEVQPRNLLTYYERRRAAAGMALPSDAFIVSMQVANEDSCYRALRILHTLYRPVSGQFRDLVAAPSDAGYQSLHTVVTLPDGRAAEVRIRTPDMEEQAMHGITLWLFRGQKIPPNFSWLHRSQELDVKTRDSSSAFWEALQSDVLRETISVVVDRSRLSVPKGSTILDAAYAAYGARANTLRSALVSLTMQPLSSPLSEDDDVHLTFDAREQVTFEWLQMISTQHARMFVVDVLKKSSRAEKQALGATLLQRELDHYGRGFLTELSRHQCQNAARHFRRNTFHDVLVLIGEGVIRARDVVFYLFPDHRSRLLPARQARGCYQFRLRVTATEHPGQDALSLLQGVVRMSDVSVRRCTTRVRAKRGIVDITIVGTADDRLQYADFVDLLERQEWVSMVQTMISTSQKAFLIASSVLALIVIAADIVLFPSFYALSNQQTLIPSVVMQVLPLLPILAVNYYLLRLLRHYIVRMRSERWFLGMGLLLNVLGLMLVVLRMVFLGVEQESLLPLVLLFTISLLYMGWRFFQADLLFVPPAIQQTGHHRVLLSREACCRKIIGYCIRLCAVAVWGLVPVYIRYTPVTVLPPLLRLFLMSLGVLIPFGIGYMVWGLIRFRRLPDIALPYNGAFLILVFGQISYGYLENLSLLYTSGTNLLLFNNFAPVIGLFLAALLWRQQIPYLRRPHTMLWIFVLMMFSGMGSGLLIYTHATKHDLVHTVLGDMLSLLSTFCDVLLTMGQIEYIRRYAKTNGVLLTLHLFFYTFLACSPLLILGMWQGFIQVPIVSVTHLVLGAGIGLIIGCGLLLNYEAFKRIDGYIAYMLFNLSVVVTFAFEAIVARSVIFSLQLLASAVLIVGAALVAEYINARSQST